MNRFNFTCPFCEVPQSMFTYYGGKGNETYVFPEVPNDILVTLVEETISCVNCNHSLRLDAERAIKGEYVLVHVEKEYHR